MIDEYIAYHSSPFTNFTFTAVHSVTPLQEDNTIIPVERKEKLSAK